MISFLFPLAFLLLVNPCVAAMFTRLSSTLKMGLSNRASFGAGCYWGTDKFIIKDFNKLYPGTVLNGKVGFMGGQNANPTYREVCGGRTGHVEVYDFTFDGKEDTYEKLVRHLFSFHDPTTADRQGNDRGTQYASAIFCYDEKQKEIATRIKAELQELVKAGKVRNYQEKTVTTAIRDATTFYPGPPDHFDYLATNPFGYCNHAYRWPAGTWPK